jgi:uncharacterized protein
MKVALIGASGKIGSKILGELLRRGHQVTGIARHPDGIAAHAHLQAVQGDVNQTEALAVLLRGHDLIASSAPFVPGISALLLQGVRASGVKRFVVVGGAGTLKKADGSLVKDDPHIPPEWLPAINEGGALLALLRADQQLDWTFFSPAALIGPGERTGKFRLGGDELIVAPDGKSSISYDDYAIAFVDEVEQSRHVRRRFTIGY